MGRPQFNPRRAYIQLNRAVRTGFQASHAEDTVPIVIQLGRVRIQGTACGL